ncbi:MAG: PAS domain-containing protein [Patescibacteria group bacterium]|nr:PAS domain-containing protein [Patescibacteria group bacterium]
MQCKDLNYYKNLIETEKDFFSELGNVIYFIDNTGVFCLVSGNVQDTLGYDYDDMIGKSFLEFVVEEDKEIALKSFSAI